MHSWSETLEHLQALRADVPRMLAEHADRGAFFDEFSRAADGILGQVAPERYEMAVAEVSAILHDFDLADDGED